MGITKKAKKVKVKYTETKSYYSEYKCPSCNVTFMNSGPRKNVLKFICECGQVLIVDNESKIPIGIGRIGE